MNIVFSITPENINVCYCPNISTFYFKYVPCFPILIMDMEIREYFVN